MNKQYNSSDDSELDFWKKVKNYYINVLGIFGM